MRSLSFLILVAGCSTDVFVLPLRGNDFSVVLDGSTLDGAVRDFSTAGDAASNGDGMIALDGGGGDGGILTLPASCAMIGCSPTVNEGDVDFEAEEISGCHAYETLTLNSVTVGKSDGQGFVACARTIRITGQLNADGKGFSSGNGPGKGGSCGGGGGHGGVGGAGTGCSGGGTYDDANLPRLPGSGGGSLAGGGGAGGGAIELASDGAIEMLVALISANGGQGTVGGGGAGGSILLRANRFTGAGSALANGGAGLVNGTGGGGGGRVAIYGNTSLATFNGVADGVGGGANGSVLP